MSPRQSFSPTPDIEAPAPSRRSLFDQPEFRPVAAAAVQLNRLANQLGDSAASDVARLRRNVDRIIAALEDQAREP
jgi:hypothetical protein